MYGKPDYTSQFQFLYYEVTGYIYLVVSIFLTINTYLHFKGIWRVECTGILLKQILDYW